MAILSRSKPRKAPSHANASVQSLLSENKESIDALRKAASELLPSDKEAARGVIPNDVFYLRYVLENSYESDEERIKSLKSNVKWRMNEGKKIVLTANNSVQAAMNTGKWENEPVRKAAPHAEIINNYFTPTNFITTTLPSTDDLVCVIRAGKFDDTELMTKISTEQLVEFLLYGKEVNARVADVRSLRLNKVIKVVTINELSEASVFGGRGEPGFKKALTEASSKGNELYPHLYGKIMLLNLPKPLVAFAKLMTPLFPTRVRKKFSFEYGPLKGIELREILVGGKHREEFVKQIEPLAYKL